MRAGLRSELCLRGWGWQAADLAARDVLEDAFRLAGAIRPTWNEGQAKNLRRSLATREARADNTCITCGASIPATRRADTLFCSKACGDKVSYARCLGQRRAETRKGRACKICAGPISEELRAGTKYCGKECRDVADRRMRFEKRKRAKG